MRLSTRLTLAMVALVLLTATAIGVLMYRTIAGIALPRGLDRIDTHAHLLATALEASVRSARSDVLGFRAAGSLDGIIHSRLAGGPYQTNRMSEAAWRAQLASRFAGELAVKPDYREFRLIGVEADGREIVRVDRSGAEGAIRIVPDAELQRKGDRDSFKETIGLPAGEVYVSPERRCICRTDGHSGS
jgi:hypothetical protein